jgi:hypothetical protein
VPLLLCTELGCRCHGPGDSCHIMLVSSVSTTSVEGKLPCKLLPGCQQGVTPQKSHLWSPQPIVAVPPVEALPFCVRILLPA